MHELSLVQGVIDAVDESARGKEKKVLSLEIRVGELAQFDLRLVRQLLRDLSKGTSIEGAKVSVRSEKSRVKCLSCGAVWSFEETMRHVSKDEREVVHFFPELLNSYFSCPRCAKSYMEILEGRSVRIAKVVIDE